MAFNPDKVTFLLNQISNSTYQTFSGIVSQLFSYLYDEIKDNPVFDTYEREQIKWRNWPITENETTFSEWAMPTKFLEAKSLAFHIYRNISKNDLDWGNKFAFNLFQHSNLSENIQLLNETFLGYLTQALEEIINANPEIDNKQPKTIQGDTIFIIHGHDNELKTEISLLLNRAGVNSFVLHEQPDRGRTIIDKLIEETGKSGYAIALLTPDDLTADGINRARQNVILEMGYFLGKIGKERVRMLVKGDIEIPSDLHGILYQKFDFAGAWKFKLLKEIQAVGIYVDIQATIDNF